MMCALCANHTRKVLRVEGWTVCQSCASNGPIKEALAALEVVKQLRAEVSRTASVSTEDVRLQEFAEERLDRARAELSSAIDALLPLVARSAVSALRLNDATDALREFEQQRPYLKEA